MMARLFLGTCEFEVEPASKPPAGISGRVVFSVGVAVDDGGDGSQSIREHMRWKDGGDGGGRDNAYVV